MELSLFSEISFIIAIATFIGLAAHLLRQPLIISYILTGIIVGPSVLDIVHAEDTVDVFAKIGITLLLFIIGLGLNPKVIREVGKVSTLTGLGQVLFTSLLGFALLGVLGYSGKEAVFIAMALSFSSTIIILKLLSDKKEQTRLYGKISIGFLLVQDIIATFALLFAAAFSGESSDSVATVELFIRGGLFAIALYAMSVYVLPHMNKVIANSQEFLFLFSIGWGLGVATLAAELGFSIEVGALFAGVTLAPMAYAQEIGARLRPLRDFFIVLFFIALGAELGLASLGENVINALILSVFVLIGNPLIVMLIMGLLGYTKKTSFKAGLAVAQISEFSLILVLLGNDLGSVSDGVVSLVTLVALITIAASTYMIIYSDKLYQLVERYLRLFERRKVAFDQEEADRYDIVLFGYKKGGAEFIKTFKRMGKSYVVVDYDPEVVDHLDHSGYHYIYGDATDIEMHEEAGVAKAKLIVSTITDHETSRFLVSQVHNLNPRAIMICHSDSPQEAKELYDLGATYIIMPHLIGSEQIGSFLRKKGFKKSEFKQVRQEHLKSIA